jgi:cytochrome c-type biogenesis protein
MNQLVQGFVFGLANIINPCVLPLYPGFLAYLANKSAGANDELGNPEPAHWLGVIVLAGVLVSMLAIGLVLALFQIAVGQGLALVLPVVYLIVIGMGILLLSNRNPFARFPVLRAPHLKRPTFSAFVYGTLYGPMIMPCCGPLVVGVFALGVADVGSFLNGVGYFLAFGLGFGLPLFILPFLALPVQREVLKRMVVHHTLLTRLAGLLLIAVGLFGIYDNRDLLGAYLHL